MTKLERVLRDLTDLHNFYRKILPIKKANAQILGLVLDASGNIIEKSPHRVPRDKDRQD